MTENLFKITKAHLVLSVVMWALLIVMSVRFSYFVKKVITLEKDVAALTDKLNHQKG